MPSFYRHVRGPDRGRGRGHHSLRDGRGRNRGLGGGARVRSIGPGTTPPTKATLEGEASGYSLVELKANGDSVTLTNNTGKNANSLVVRASIPDSAGGGGINATLNLYVNGAFRQAISLSSQQAWNYRGATTNPDDPGAGGQAYRFYNEFPLRVTGAAIAPGSTIQFRKDAGNTAAVYDIDSVDLENVGAALAQPHELDLGRQQRRGPELPEGFDGSHPEHGERRPHSGEVGVDPAGQVPDEQPGLQAVGLHRSEGPGRRHVVHHPLSQSSAALPTPGVRRSWWAREPR